MNPASQKTTLNITTTMPLLNFPKLLTHFNGRSYVEKLKMKYLKKGSLLKNLFNLMLNRFFTWLNFISLDFSSH